MSFRFLASILGLLSIIISLLSCSNVNVEDSVNVKALNDSLRVETKTLATKNDSLYAALEKKMQDTSTRQLAEYWYPRAMQFQFDSHEIYEYLENCMSKLVSDSSSFNADSLYRNLYVYRLRIFRIDPEIHEAINRKADIITHYFDSLLNKEPKNIEPHLAFKSKEEKFYVLELTRKNIRAVENAMLSFCNLKVDKLI
jgi:GldM N-terminal domain